MKKIYVYKNEIPKESYDLIMDGQNFIQLEHLYQKHKIGSIMMLTCGDRKEIHVRFYEYYGGIVTFRKLKPRVRPSAIIDTLTPTTQNFNKDSFPRLRKCSPRFAKSELQKLVG